MTPDTSLPRPGNAADKAVVIPAHVQQLLAFDFGTKRTGCASGNRVFGAASPLPTIKAEGADARFAAIEKLIKEWQPQALVIGVPYHPDGAPHENTAKALKFGRHCAGALTCLFMKWMSATVLPKPWPVVPKMPMLRRHASSWSNF